VTGALGVALAIEAARRAGHEPLAAARDAAEKLRATRPTAVNLGWGIDRVIVAGPDPDAMVREAHRLAELDAATNAALVHRGADLLADLLDGVEGERRVMTHCNAGALAAAEWGSALGVIGLAWERRLLDEAFACETRPLLQGARLTTWELRRMGVPHRLLVDSAAAGLLASGAVHAVIVGADRIAANGDVANKVGTYTHALAAHRHGVPFVVAAPESTIDDDLADGSAIPIEERAEDEVLAYRGQRVTPEGTRAFNPAFDVTPAELITAIVTDERVWRVS
jgi:methylthioribose-1-phosphate isomerase